METTEQFYKKVYIHSKDDLPKTEGTYDCLYSDHVTFGKVVYNNSFASSSDIWWINKIDWYLLPIASLESKVEITDEDEEIDLSSPDYHNNCRKCGNTFWTKDAMNVICESCKSSIQLSHQPAMDVKQAKYDIKAETLDAIIAKQAELIESQQILINFISLWGKFADLLQEQPLSAKFIANQFTKIGVTKEKLESELKSL
jgi:hypothetical protein